MNDFPLTNWLPYRLINQDSQLKCYWLNTFGEAFTEPFFEETISKCRGLNRRLNKAVSVSDTTMIKEWAAYLESAEPAAFIFHISRCGSTLLAQLLAESEQNIILSEVPFFDELLRLPFKDPDWNTAPISELLGLSIKFYGQKKTGKEQRIFIKTDSWHLFFYQQLRDLYPLTPFIFVYRSPDEVFRSHKKMPGMQAVPGLLEPQLFGFNPKELTNMHADAYLAGVIESYLKRYLEVAETDQRCLLLNYNDGPMTMLKKLMAFTNVTPPAEDLLNMTERSRYHSKRPKELFGEEAVTSIPQCLGKAMELYYMLEEKRRAAY